MIAINRIRPDPHYRREAVDNGLRAVGYELRTSGTPKSADDLLVIWNRYGAFQAQADQWELSGGTVLVVENGYLGKDKDGRQYYAIAVHGHNGSGWIPASGPDRFERLGVNLEPWRDGEHVLVCGQRGIGSRSMASPYGWHAAAAKRVKALTDQPIRIRPHPGNKPAARPLEDDLAGAYACVVWSSTSGVKALTMGIPVFYDAPHWICEGAAQRLESIADPRRDDVARLTAMQQLAWAQWSVAEIESGQPFRAMRDENFGGRRTW